jgi:hypothetical protein
LGGVSAAVWLIGLLAAAPALQNGARTSAADRVRDALVLGVAIPFALGIAGLLYPAACWIALAGCVALAYRSGAFVKRNAAPPEPVPYLLIGAIALVAWPPLMRPVLDGDSLSYHLPNAAAWVHAHGLWTTDGRYWWYPPASELFASGLFAVSGPFALPWSGAGALALVGLRIWTWARAEFAAPAWLADALAAATVTAAPLAFQAGSLQNDVWLAAFFLEALWTLRRDPVAAARTVAVTVLLKPYGFLLAVVAALSGKATRNVWLVAIGAFAIWAVHDALLWHAAIVAPASTSSANTWSSTIAAHGLPALGLLASVMLRASPFALLALFAAVAAPFAPRAGRRLGWAALATVVLFLAMPLAYADTMPQLATGASLRYAAPAIALGALLLTPWAARLPRVAAALLILSAAFGAGAVLAVYWNDAPTRIAIPFALIAAGNVALARRLRAPWQIPAGLGIAVAVTWVLAARYPLAYYTDALRVDGRATGAYAWIARTQPRAIGGWGLKLGAVNALAPAARAVDLPEGDPCAAARANGVLLVAVAESTRSPAFNAARLKAARACGRIRFDDGLAVVAGD